MFALNINTDTDTRFLIHSIIDLLYANKVRRDYLENILYAMLQMEEFLYIDSIIVDNAKALYMDTNNDLSKSYVFNFRLNGDILKIKEKWDKVYIPCQSDVDFTTCKKCYNKERIIMEEVVPLYIDKDVVVRSFLKGCTPNEGIAIDGNDHTYNQLCKLLIKDGYIEKFYDSFVIPTAFTLHLDTCVDNSWQDPDSIKVGYNIKLLQVFVNKYIKERKPDIFNDYIENNIYYAISKGNMVSSWFSNRIKEEVAYQESGKNKPIYEEESEEDTMYFQEMAKSLLKFSYKSDTVWDVFSKYGYNMSAPVVTLSHTMCGGRRMVYYHISDPEKYDNAHTLRRRYIKSPNDWLYTMLQLCKQHKYYLEDVLCNNIECLDKWECVHKFNEYLKLLKYSYSLHKSTPSVAYNFTPIIKLELDNLNKYTTLSGLLEYRDMLRDISIEDLFCKRIGGALPLYFWDINIVLSELSIVSEYKVCNNLYYIARWCVTYTDRIKFRDVIDDYPSKEFVNRGDYLEHILALSNKVYEYLGKYIINKKIVLLADSNEKDKEEILGSDFVNTFLKRGFNIDNMCTRIERTKND